MDKDKKQQSYEEEFSPEISPNYRQDVHEPPRHTHSAFFIGIIIFAIALLLLITFVYF